MTGIQPSIARRQLAAELRRPRTAADLTGQQLAARRSWSQSKVSKIETGRTRPAIEDVQEWAAECRADADVVSRLLELVQAAQTEATPWHGDFTEQQRAYGDLEAAATKLEIYQPQVIPGIFQTAEYARRLYLLLDRFDPRQLRQAVAARLERQALLFDQSKRVEAVITETALRWRPGPAEACRAKLDRLLQLMTVDSVQIGVLPHATSAPVLPGNQFLIFTLPEETVVTVETYTAEVSISDPVAVAEYPRVFEMHHKAALFGASAVAFIHQLVQQLDR